MHRPLVFLLLPGPPIRLPLCQQGRNWATTHSNPSFVPNIPGSLASTLGGNLAACAAPPRGRLGARPDAPATAPCRPPQRRCDAVALVTEQHNGFLAGLARLAGEIHGCHSHGSKTAALRGRQGTKTCGGGVRNGGQSASAGRSGSGESARGFTNLRWHKCGGATSSTWRERRPPRTPFLLFLLPPPWLNDRPDFQLIQVPCAAPGCAEAKACGGEALAAPLAGCACLVSFRDDAETEMHCRRRAGGSEGLPQGAGGVQSPPAALAPPPFGLTVLDAPIWMLQWRGNACRRR